MVKKVTKIETRAENMVTNPFYVNATAKEEEGFFPDTENIEQIQELAKRYGVSPDLLTDIIEAFNFLMSDIKESIHADLVDLYKKIEESR